MVKPSFQKNYDVIEWPVGVEPYWSYLEFDSYCPPASQTPRAQSPPPEQTPIVRHVLNGGLEGELRSDKLRR